MKTTPIALLSIFEPNASLSATPLTLTIDFCRVFMHMASLESSGCNTNITVSRPTLSLYWNNGPATIDDQDGDDEEGDGTDRQTWYNRHYRCSRWFIVSHPQ
jgi:hypothetical protein